MELKARKLPTFLPTEVPGEEEKNNTKPSQNNNKTNINEAPFLLPLLSLYFGAAPG